MKREFLNPEMNISMFEKESVVTNASVAMAKVENGLEAGTLRINGEEVKDLTKIISITF